MRSMLPPSLRLTFLLAFLAAAPAAIAQVGDPVPGSIPLAEISVHVEFVVQLPDSGSASRPRARPMTLVGDGSGRRFVADQNGLIYQVHADTSLSVFLDLGAATDLLANQGQQGVNSFAFHPDYFESGSPGFGKLYTTSSEPASSGVADFPLPAGAPSSHHSVLYEWTVEGGDPDAIDPSSTREVLRIAQPYDDHNVGQIAFDPGASSGSPDRGLLYVASGDGGNVCCTNPVDPYFVGQDLSSPLGAILRIDPLEPSEGGSSYTVPPANPFASDGDPDTLGEIWAYGLRNPHRFAWDRGGDGKLLISDIGQANVEEINLGLEGANYGWSEREGTFLVVHDNNQDVFELPPDDALFGFTYPVLQYDHDEGDRAVSGGYVSRDPRVPQVLGQYLFGDLVSGRVFFAAATGLDGSGVATFEQLRLIDTFDFSPRSLLEMVGGGSPASRADLRFGLDDLGAIYLLTKQDGSIRRIVASPRCQDGLDNDGDGRVDADGGASFGLPPEQLTVADPQCITRGVPNPRKNRERQGRCGLGHELVLLLGPLAALRRWGRQPRRLARFS